MISTFYNYRCPVARLFLTLGASYEKFSSELRSLQRGVTHFCAPAKSFGDILEVMSVALIGSSAVMRSMVRSLSQAAHCDKSVLLFGETGTGKDLAARQIHELSARKMHPFVAINCSNLPDGLFESELFGHERGAFTGAIHDKSGLLDEAGNGTLFIDEIGELPLHLQAKILRVLDKKEARKIGATRTRIIKARFIFATNRDLLRNVSEGRFRGDLYYRINVVLIRIPSLRERKGDIPELVKYFVDRENSRSLSWKTVGPGVLDKLMSYEFPGNVRELEHIIERALVFSERDLVEADDIRFDSESSLAKGELTGGQLKRALEQCQWNKTRAARILGKSRRQLYRLLQKYQMEDCIRRMVL
jgi:transcriptional regulator with GAF, ATPase, and Fis domain